jgi:hypothetical protein
METNQKMTEDNVSVPRQKLLTILVQVENALDEIRQLKKEITHTAKDEKEHV